MSPRLAFFLRTPAAFPILAGGVRLALAGGLSALPAKGDGVGVLRHSVSLHRIDGLDGLSAGTGGSVERVVFKQHDAAVVEIIGLCVRIVLVGSQRLLLRRWQRQVAKQNERQGHHTHAAREEAESFLEPTTKNTRPSRDLSTAFQKYRITNENHHQRRRTTNRAAQLSPVH